MELSEAINKANQRAHDLHGLRLQSDERSRLSASLFAVAQQHQSAILMLLSNERPIESSAFSLLRLLLETTARGEWVLRCANEQQIKNIIEGNQRQIDMASIFSSIEKALTKSAGRDIKAKSLYDNHWRVLSAYTHGYEQQVQRWLTTKDIEPKYAKEEIQELIYLSDLIAKLAHASTRSMASEKE